MSDKYPSQPVMDRQQQAEAVCNTVLQAIELLRQSGVTNPAAILQGAASALGNVTAVLALPSAREEVLAATLATARDACRGRALSDAAVAGQA